MPISQWSDPIETYEMGPLEVLDYGINWGSPAPPSGLGSWLADNESIVGTPTVTEDSGDGKLTINPEPQQTLVNGGIVSWWLSTPTVGVNYQVHVTITTNLGHVSTRSILIKGVAR